MNKQENLIKQFKLKIEAFTYANFPYASRIHLLNCYNAVNKNVFVKRDDELGFGVSGSKIRKYLSLIPFLLNNKFETVILKGGLQSNNILSAAQLLIEHKIKPIILIPNTNQKLKPIGNFLLTCMFLNDDNIIYYSHNENEAIEKYQLKMQATGKNIFILNEGANTEEALNGCLTLPYDILKNEEKENIYFDHIFIDAGTGVMAAALILAFHYLQKKTKIHVLLVAGNKDYFENNLNNYLGIFNQTFNSNISFPTNFNVYYPTNAKSFGSTNSKVFEYISNNCKQNGFFLDPIYSAKLFFEGNIIITEKQITGNILLLHSGGALSLIGFQNKLEKFASL